MVATNFTLFMLLSLADIAVFSYLHIRRQRRIRLQRMMRSLCSALERDSLMLQQAG
jgi:hypothetical protein